MNQADNREMYDAGAGTEDPGARSVGIGIGTDGAIDAWDDEIDPTTEDAYWRENYRQRAYVPPGDAYDPYDAAYRTGYENYNRFRGRSFDDVEAELRKDYERRSGGAGFTWERAKDAARDAWQRLEDYFKGEPDEDRR
jgi:hypothetical protein